MSGLDFLPKDHRRLFIGGSWSDAEGGATFDVLDPADGSVLCQVADATVADGQRAELVAVAHGYWRWLTEATFFNPQEAGNQAIGCVVGGLMLARHLPPEQDEPVRARALALYADKIRAHRVADRGALLPPEHGGAYDNNYGPISLSFLAQAHRISGEAVNVFDR